MPVSPDIIPPEFMHMADNSGCSFTTRGQKPSCLSAFSCPILHDGKALAAQGCGWIAFSIWPLGPPTPRATAWCLGTEKLPAVASQQPVLSFPGGDRALSGPGCDAQETARGCPFAVWDVCDSEPLHSLVCKLLVQRISGYVSLLWTCRALKSLSLVLPLSPTLNTL